MSDASNAFIERITTELGRIRTGTSKYVAGSVMFEMTKLPFGQLLQRFQSDPTNMDLMKMLKSAGEQDFGHRFGLFIQEAIDDFRRANGESVPLPVKPPPTSLFHQELYNQLSTILQYTIGRQLDQKQIERLQFDTNRLAESLTKQIATEARAQAGEMCKVLARVLSEEIETVKARLDAADAAKAQLAADLDRITE